MTTDIKIMLVDDHKMIIDSLRLLFNLFDGFKVACSESDSRNVMSKLEEENIDILVTDYNMPYLDGLQLTQLVKEKYPLIKVLLLTVNEDATDIQNAYNAGASGYVMKKANRKQIEEALRTVSSGQKYYGQEVMELIMGGTSKSNQDTIKILSVENSNLTKREIEIIKLLAQEKSSPDIAEELFISQGTVESHRHNILRKLKVKTTIGVVKYAIRAGIV